jgi:7,8-dihydropterin-6-yl-methyl-4-(beta-D-ribofuranosyl)aminobenzene 5'-phosphate synthase
MNGNLRFTPSSPNDHRSTRGGLLRAACGFALVGLLMPAGLVCASEPPTSASDEDEPAAAQESQPSPPGGEIVLRIVYDNNPHQDGLETAWGFGCVITGCEKIILFDTGGEGDILLRNMDKCGIDPRAIDTIVLSHIHGDHVGGLDEFLAVNPKVHVYLPKVFPGEFKAQVRRTAEKVTETDVPVEICAGVCTTGVLLEPIPEQGISIDTPGGILVITGCAHPGIVEITEAAHAHTKKPVRLVLGGFHLVRASESRLDHVIAGLRKLDVQQVAPCHCSGDNARAAMKKAFGDRCLEVGVGSRLVFPSAAQSSD